MKVRVFFAVLVCKALRLVSRLLHKGGTAMPGRWALKICPELLTVLAKDVKSVAVTGTNGKTTTVRMVEEAFSQAGLNYFTNRSGANLISGIATEFVMNCTLSGKMKKEYAVLECDEAAAKTVFPQIKPAAVIVTNLFRDQLDRFGTTENTLAAIRAGIAGAPEAVMILNADDPVTSTLALDLPNRAVFFGMDRGALEKPGTVELTGMDHCLECGAELTYDYHNYGHLGGFRCPSCKHRRPKADVAVTEIAAQEIRSTTAIMNVFGEKRIVNVGVAGLYNVCNAAAAIAAARELGISPDVAVKAVEVCECGFGRMEHFPLGREGATMMLVKNSVGCNQVIDFLKNVKGHFCLVLCINNRVSDGTDISWLNDADFEALCGMTGLESITVSGDRTEEIFARLVSAGISAERITKEKDYNRLVERMGAQEKPVFILPTYTAMLELREFIIKKTGGKDFWE